MSITARTSRRSGGNSRTIIAATTIDAPRAASNDRTTGALPLVAETAPNAAPPTGMARPIIRPALAYRARMGIAVARLSHQSEIGHETAGAKANPNPTPSAPH